MTFNDFRAKWEKKLAESKPQQKCENNSKLVFCMQSETLMFILEVLEDYHKNVSSKS